MKHPHRHSGSPADAGFTLVELLMCVVVIGVMVAAAAPSFDAAVTARRLESGTNQIVNAVRLARAEAIRRAGVVVVRPLTGTQWSSGLIVHLEADADPSNALTVADTVIRQFTMPALSSFDGASPAALAFDAQGRHVALTPDGQPQEGSLQMWIKSKSMTVLISRAGAASLSGPVN
jgi:type IV fimbrial biogenesis protein FimT